MKEHGRQECELFWGEGDDHGSDTPKPSRHVQGVPRVLGELDEALFTPGRWFAIDAGNARVPRLRIPDLSAGLSLLGQGPVRSIVGRLRPTFVVVDVDLDGQVVTLPPRRSRTGAPNGACGIWCAPRAAATAAPTSSWPRTPTNPTWTPSCCRCATPSASPPAPLTSDMMCAHCRLISDELTAVLTRRGTPATSPTTTPWPRRSPSPPSPESPAATSASVDRLLTQVVRIREINHLPAMTPEAVEAAREALLIGRRPRAQVGGVAAYDREDGQQALRQAGPKALRFTNWPSRWPRKCWRP